MIIFHTADWHPKSGDLQEFESVRGQMLVEAKRLSPDLIVVPGDLTDSNCIRLESTITRSVVETVQALADIAPVAICSGTPSHDGKSPEIYRYIRGRYPVLVSSSPEQFLLTDKGVFVGIDQPEASLCTPVAVITQVPHIPKEFAVVAEEGIEVSERKIGAALAGLFATFGQIAAPWIRSGIPHVLTGHWQVGGAMVSDKQILIGRDIEISKDHILMADPTVVCLGHIHKAQQIGDRTFYCGSLKQNTVGETDPKGVYAHTLSPSAGADGRAILMSSEFITLKTKKRIAIKIDLSDEKNDLLAAIEKEDQISGSDIKVLLTTWEDAASVFDREGLTRMLIGRGATSVDIQITRQPREQIRCAEIVTRHRLEEKVVAMASLRGEQVSEELIDRARSLNDMTSEDLEEQVRRFLDWEGGVHGTA